MKNHSSYRHISNGQIIRTWSAGRADHRAEPEWQPAPRPLHWRVQIGTWNDQPHAHRDQHRKRAHLRRQQKQTRQQERATLSAQLKRQQ